MDKKSKILLWVLALLIVGSVAATYWRIVLKKDYVIESQVDCDPYENKCFVWECDPASTVEGEKCTGDPESDIWYFQVAKRNAANIPLCNPETDENCDPWTCPAGEKDCEQVMCSEELMEAQYASSCVDPVQFTIDNPIDEEEEMLECEDGDEECLAAQEELELCDPEQDSECVLEEDELIEEDETLETEIEAEVEDISVEKAAESANTPEKEL